MRRTRHVVLPVRSWQYTGLLIVSLACLTLGLVSRDREGQAGSLAGPDLQHGAPHKVDACPNELAFNRLLFYDDLAPEFGPIRTDKTKKHTAGSENVLSVNKREARENERVRDIASIRRTSSSAILQRSIKRASRFSDDQKNSKLVRDHWTSRHKNSLAIDDHRKGNRDAVYQRTRSTRSMNRNYGMRDFRVENRRRFSRISDQQSETLRTITERSSLERQKNRQHQEVRNTEARETVTELLVENRAERSRIRQIRNDQSDRHDCEARNVRMTVDLSATRKMISPACETDSSTIVSSLTNERRIQRFTRSVRVHQSRVRKSVVEHSIADFRSSERKSTKESKIERRSGQIGSIRSNVRLLPSVAELRSARLNRQVRESRTIVGDSSSRDSRLAVEVRDERLNRRTSPFFHSDPVIDKARLIVKRTRMSLNRPTENSRIPKRDAKQEELQLTSQRRSDRRTRDIRDNRSFQTSVTIRYSGVLRKREGFDLQTDRGSRSSSDFRHQGSTDSYSFERRGVRLSDRGIDFGNRESRLTEERENNGEIKRTRSSGPNARSRNSPSLVARTIQRMGRYIRATQRDSRIRDALRSRALHYRDARYSEREFSQSARYFTHAAVIRRFDTSLPRHGLSSKNHREQRFEKHNRASASHRIMKERGLTRILYGGDLMHRDELLPYRQGRVRSEKNNETTRGNFDGNRKIREALVLAVSSKKLKNPHMTEVTWADVTDSLIEGIVSPTKYDTLQQLGIQLLCVVYCATHYSGKGGLFRESLRHLVK